MIGETAVAPLDHGVDFRDAGRNAIMTAMRLLKLANLASQRLGLYGSSNALVTHLGELGGEGALTVIRVEAGGRLGRHKARLRQAMYVLVGSGQAAGSDGDRQTIGAGDVLIWEAGEDHETDATETLVLLVIEAELLRVLEVN